MQTTENTNGQVRSQGPHVHTIEFHVNNRPVQIVGPVHTGLEVKEAAITQGVKIQRDFLLYLEIDHHPNQPIGDDEKVTVTKHSRFKAIGDDDNS